MALIDFANTFPFRDGATISGAALDSAFAKFTTLANATLLDATNFREIAGIKNEQKASAYTWVPLIFSFPAIQQALSLTKRYRGVIAYPHYAQFRANPVDLTSQNGTTSEKNSTSPDTFQVVSVHGSYHSGANIAAADTIKAYVVFRSRLGEAQETYTHTISTGTNGNNAILAAGSIAKTACDYVHVDLEFYTDGTAGTRAWSNVIVCVWLKLPHVR